MADRAIQATIAAPGMLTVENVAALLLQCSPRTVYMRHAVEA